MRITGFTTTLVDLPLDKPIATAIHNMRSVGCVLLELSTDQGLTGESYVFTLNAVRLKALHEMLLSFTDHVVGRDPHYHHQIYDRIWREINPIGHQGFAIAALAAIDTACWDLVAKAAGQPLYKLFGACRDRVDTYASGGLWLSQSIDELTREAADFVDQGFRSMKIRLGSAKAADDVARVAAVREAVGEDVTLLADANQGLNVKQAMRLGQDLAQFNLGWFEEPIDYQNLAGLAEIRSRLPVPIAAGETEHSRFGISKLLQAGAVDILMPDLQRVGGLSEMRRVAAIASSYHIPISTHIFTEQSLAIAASEAGCMSVEHMPWFSPLFTEEMVMEEGAIRMPDHPGIGFSFNHDVIDRYKMK